MEVKLQHDALGLFDLHQNNTFRIVGVVVNKEDLEYCKRNYSGQNVGDWESNYYIKVEHVESGKVGSLYMDEIIWE